MKRQDKNNRMTEAIAFVKDKKKTKANFQTKIDPELKKALDIIQQRESITQSQILEAFVEHYNSECNNV